MATTSHTYVPLHRYRGSNIDPTELYIQSKTKKLQHFVYHAVACVPTTNMLSNVMCVN